LGSLIPAYKSYLGKMSSKVKLLVLGVMMAMTPGRVLAGRWAYRADAPIGLADSASKNGLNAY
jgi:hypothetical protein